jgi:hypothetical protein
MIRSFKISAHIETTQLYIPEDGKFRKYRCDNLKSYKFKNKFHNEKHLWQEQ